MGGFYFSTKGLFVKWYLTGLLAVGFFQAMVPTPEWIILFHHIFEDSPLTGNSFTAANRYRVGNELEEIGSHLDLGRTLETRLINFFKYIKKLDLVQHKPNWLLGMKTMS